MTPDQQMRALRLHWSAEDGWMVDVPATLSAPALKRVIAWALPRQVDRYRTLTPGPKRDELKGALERLRAGIVEQRVVGDRGDGKGDMLLFSAPRPAEDRKIISIGTRLSMAATWRATSGGVAFAATKDMINVMNGASATRVIRVFRAYQFNNGVTAVTGVLTTMQIRRLTAASAGSAVTPVKHDTSSPALDVNTTAGTGQTTTGTDIFRRFLWSNDEPTVSSNTQDEWELLVPFAEVWNAGYGDTNIEPIVCRAGFGFQVFHSGVTIVGTNDFEIEFTDAAT
jgi:hypothetical protein